MSAAANAKPDPWFVVSQLLPVTEKEVRHLGITTARLQAQNPDLA